MSAKKQIAGARGAAATVAALFALHIVAVHTPAQAQVAGEMPGAELVLVPEITPVAASAATPTLMPAIATPGVRSSQSDLAKPAPSAAATPAPRQVPCAAPADLAHFDRPLLHTMRRLASGMPLVIVAIGSSSTAGALASSPAATYPARLAVELRARFSGNDITVFNRGVNGEVTDEMMARFATDVIAAHPQLVLWQVGTNSVLRDNPLQAAFIPASSGSRGTQGRRRGRRSYRSAICAQGSRQVRDAGHGRTDRARGQGRERRSVPPLRGDARLA